MESSISTPAPRQTAGRFALAASVCILVGIAVCAGSVTLDLWAGRSRRLGLDDVADFGLLISIVSIYLAAPLLGVIAILRAPRNEDRGGQQEVDSESKRHIRKTANRLLLASALLVSMALAPLFPALRLAGIGLQVWLLVLTVVGLQMGRTSRRLTREVGLDPSWRGILLLTPFAIMLFAGILAVTGIGSYVAQRLADTGKTPTFAGPTDGFKQTMVVPTLDTPCPPHRTVIWCSSFQLAWNKIRDEVVGGPVEVIGAEETTARLNAAKHSATDLDAPSVYAAAGWIKAGIREQIRKDMAAKFPAHVLPDFNDFTSGILAYSYLKANVPFKHPFRQRDEGLAFTDSAGIETQVAGFGLWQAHRPAYENIREQVEVLFVRSKGRERSWELSEYALDLCRHSEPYQVVVARVEPKGSLAETLQYIRTGMEDFKTQPGYPEARWLDKADEVMVPEMFWRIDHHFKELIGKGVANVGMPIVEALQTIEFRLDRSGAILESEALGSIASRPRHFEFNRPFLIYMQKRDAEHPFFVMWVDNAELLVRK